MKSQRNRVVLYLAINDSLIQVDTISLHIPTEEKFTKDSVNICVDDVVCNQVQHATMANITNADANPLFWQQETFSGPP